MCISNLVLFCALSLALFGHCRASLILRFHCCALQLELLCTSNLDLSGLFTTVPLLNVSPLANILYLQPYFYTAMDVLLSLVTALPCSDTAVHLYPCLVPVFIFILVLTLPYTSNLVMALPCSFTALHVEI